GAAAARGAAAGVRGVVRGEDPAAGAAEPLAGAGGHRRDGGLPCLRPRPQRDRADDQRGRRLRDALVRGAVGSVFERLQERLERGGVAFTVTRHEPVFTSEQAAAVRGTPLASGAKALVVRAGEGFVLLVLPADRKLDSRKARAGLGVKS